MTGVGQLTALAFIAAIDDPERFRRSRDVGAYLGDQYLRESYNDYLINLISVGGRHHGVWSNIGAKSLLWYNQDAFDNAGYVPPTDWQSLMALSDRMVADGTH